MAGVLVRDVPHGQGRVVVVALGDPVGEGEGEVAVEPRGGAPGLPAARPEGVALPVDGEDLGVRGAQPRGWGGRRGREVDGDAVVVEQPHDLVEPAELVLALRRLEPGPREHPEGDEADAGLAHEAHVVGPDLARPLLRVVVAAEGDAVVGPWTHGGQCVARSQHLSTDTNNGPVTGVRMPGWSANSPVRVPNRDVKGRPDPLTAARALSRLSGTGCLFLIEVVRNARRQRRHHGPPCLAREPSCEHRPRVRQRHRPPVPALRRRRRARRLGPPRGLWRRQPVVVLVRWGVRQGRAR